MKKIFTLIAGVMLAASASAETPYKNLYTVAEVYPAGAGLVYLDAKNEAQKEFVKEQSEDFEENVFIKETIGENGSQDQYVDKEGYQEDATGTLGNYEELLFVEPNPGYEFVCVSNTIKEDGIYTPAECYQSHTGEGTDSFVFSWEYSITDGNLINVNSASHEVDGNSTDPGQQAVFDKDNWDEEPNTTLYVIFRKTGEELPKFDPTITGINSVLRPADENAPIYNVAGAAANANTKGILIKNGKKFINK